RRRDLVPLVVHGADLSLNTVTGVQVGNDRRIQRRLEADVDAVAFDNPVENEAAEYIGSGSCGRLNSVKITFFTDDGEEVILSEFFHDAAFGVGPGAEANFSSFDFSCEC